MAADSSPAAREQAWSRIVSLARSADVVAFADKGVAVLDRSRCGADALPGWEELLAQATAAGLVKFSAQGIVVLLW